MGVQVGSIITYRYIESDTMQYDRKILSIADAEIVRSNKKAWLAMDGKGKKEFETNNKVKFEFDEITEDSPFGIAIMGLEVGKMGKMELPLTQGGIHEIELISIK